AKIIKTGEESFQICANCHSEGEKRPKNLAQDRLREGTRQSNPKTETRPANK
ncbi:unnamed protein product, partial [marine sediment metagenome]